MRLRKTDFIFLVIVFVLFYITNRLSFSAADDYWYTFVGNSDGSFRRVASFTDALTRQLHDYTTWNGRIIVHTITSWFCGVGGMDAFVICNSLVFMLLLMGMIVLSRQYNGFRTSDRYLFAVVLFVFMPAQGMVFLGSIAMCVNYLWTSCAVIWFLVLYYHIKGNHTLKTVTIPLVFLAAVLVGSMQESFTIGLSGALFVSCIFRYRSMSRAEWSLVLGLWIGTAIVTLAPGNFVRMSEQGVSAVSGFVKMVSNIAGAFFDAWMMDAVIILTAFGFLTKRDGYRNFVNKYSILYLAVFLNLCIVAIQSSGVRQLTCIELFSAMILVGMLYTFFPNTAKRYNRWLSVSACVLVIGLYIPAYSGRKDVQTVYLSLMNAPIEDGSVIDKGWIPMCRKASRDFILGKYAYTFGLEDWVYSGMSAVRSDGRNQDSIKVVLPAKVCDLVAEYDRNNKNGILTNTEYGYYVIANPDYSGINGCEILSEPKSLLGKIRNSIMGVSSEYHVDVRDRLRELDYNGKKYYIMYFSADKVFEINWR